MDKRSEIDGDSIANRLDSWLSPVVNLEMTYKGQKDSLEDLPKSDNKLGDAYYVVSEEKQYAYNGLTWELIDDTHGEGVKSFFNYKGFKDTVAELPVDGNEVSDAWYVVEDSSIYLWNGTAWDSIGGITIETSVDWNDITGKPSEFYVHPQSPAGAKENGFYKVAIDGDGHVTEVVPVTMDDLIDIGIVHIDGGKLVEGESSVSTLSIAHDEGAEVSIIADANMTGVQIVDDSGKVLPIGIVNGESVLGDDEIPVNQIYVNDINDINGADGTLVPNINTMKNYIDEVAIAHEPVDNSEIDSLF